MAKYKVYLITAPNGKKYIGLTSRTLKERFAFGYGYKRNKPLWADIQKFGWNAFEKNVLYETESKEKAEEKEAEMIAQYDTLDAENGYNFRKGGSRYGFNDVTIKLLSESHRGKIMPEEQKKKISEKLKGRKTSKGTLGFKYSAESCARISEGLKRYYKHAESPILGTRNPRARGVVNLTTGKKYATIKDAQADCNIKTHASICHACEGKTATAGGYKWAYLGEN